MGAKSLTEAVFIKTKSRCSDLSAFEVLFFSSLGCSGAKDDSMKRYPSGKIVGLTGKLLPFAMVVGVWECVRGGELNK